MKETINKWFKLFGLMLWEFQETRTTEPKYIETNALADATKQLKEKTEHDTEMFKAARSEKRLGVPHAS